MAQQIPLNDDAHAINEHADAIRDDGTHEITPDLAYKRLAIVNVMFYGLPNAGDRQWILIDAGVMGTKGLIEKAAKERFGEGSRPAAIIMTHGHFDHVGALKELSEEWDTPIYAHPLEVPFLNGTRSYPPADPTVGGGLMALLSPLYPRSPIDVSAHLQTLPEDGSVPGMSNWQWIYTPGHAPGHISLWRKEDRTLIVGDAFVTTAQESAYSVATQNAEMHGPPMYFTPDWANAKFSVGKLAALEPELVITGHGPAMSGLQMRDALQVLADNFDEVAVPEHGKYVDGAAATHA
jgi:glyoxylase-like metal-dependent hydrolase (beta-lactamase superfamily II)